jgi:hypothetical protein
MVKSDERVYGRVLACVDVHVVTEDDLLTRQNPKLVPHALVPPLWGERLVSFH